MKKLFFVSVLLLFVSTIFAQIPCVVIEWNTERTEYTVVNYNARPLYLPIDGIDPDLEVLIKRTPYAIPDYDPRITYLGVTHSISETEDLEFPGHRMWLTTYSLIEMPTEAKMVSVDEAENDANYQVFPTEKHLKYLTVATAIIDRKASGLTITPAQQAILDKLQAKAALIWSNHITALQKKTLLEQGLDVDLDSDWESVDPETIE